MNNVHILDCTLRDGGYVNQFEFGKKTITKMIDKLTEAKIDIIECGFLISGQADPEKSLFDSVEAMIPHLKRKDDHLMYVAMIAFGDISESEISPYDGTSIDGIRITFHEAEIEPAVLLGKQLKNKGYQIFMQPVGTMAYSDLELIHLIEKINQLEPFAFYLVDTLGTMYQNDLLRMFYLVNHNLKDSISIGFHSHNNLQLSFSNAQELLNIHTNRNIIIDSSVFGMGRGAGNLCTELITRYINDNFTESYVITPLLEIVDEHLNKIFSVTPWGYSVPYYLAAATGCHPNYSSYLLNKQTLTVKSINTILNGIPAQERHLFNKAYIEKLYQQYQKYHVDDAQTLLKLKQFIKNRTILVLAPGKSLSTEERKIQKYIKSQHPFIVAINFIPKSYPIDLLFVSNLKRFQEIENLKEIAQTTTIVITSNIKSDLDYIINYSDLIEEHSDESDNAGIMCLKLLLRLEIHSVSLAGFDGFSLHNSSNYIDNTLIQRSDRDILITKTQLIKQQIQNLQKNMQIHFITPSLYQTHFLLQKYQTIIFDLDGTLVNTYQGIFNCYQHAASVLGLELPTEKMVDGAIGAPLLKVFQTIFQLDLEEAKKAVAIYRERYARKGIYESEIYAGMETFLSKLTNAGYTLAVATLKNEGFAKTLLEHLRISKYFSVICGIDEKDHLTKKEIIEKALFLLKADKEHSVLIGDSSYDAVGAQEAGIDFVAVTYGFGFQPSQSLSEEMHLASANSVEQLSNLFQLNENSP